MIQNKDIPCPHCGSPVIDGKCEDVGGHFCQYTRDEDLCVGIEIEAGVYSGCDQSGGDCPRCGC